ncbi:MAG: hypothetical protein KA354_14405 [Phycisphaerae bacterium]|nr:hypothetical protein [Phycisphaerae bacterium]
MDAVAVQFRVLDVGLDVRPGLGPGVAFECFLGDADAEVALSVLSAEPGSDDAVAILGDGVGEVLPCGLGFLGGDGDGAEQDGHSKEG